ncbi:sugar phosphate isomerase/epimerase family protein [Atopococcus tabaci]|uniref:sugar phosphate isomerase/epimerase family protein n=1 Tax=Atopococcus tabaci TaxID=269774 RepID=UPI0003F6EFE4|nr:TIM barrel protein [Atopococcus tabaci]
MKQENLVINTLVFDELIKNGTHQIDLLDRIPQLGIKKVEIRREYLRDEDELTELKEKAQALEMELFYSVPDILFQEKLLEQDTLVQYFEEYNMLGAKQLKIVAGYAEAPSEEEMEMLEELMEEYYIHHLTLENDQSDYSTPEKLQRLLQQLLDIGIPAALTFDTGNFLIIGEDPVKAAETLKEDVSFVHMKNVNADTHELTLVDEGDVPMFDVMEVFPEDIHYAIEYPCGSNPFETVEKEIQKLTK